MGSYSVMSVRLIQASAHLPWPDNASPDPACRWEGSFAWLGEDACATLACRGVRAAARSAQDRTTTARILTTVTTPNDLHPARVGAGVTELDLGCAFYEALGFTAGPPFDLGTTLADQSENPGQPSRHPDGATRRLRSRTRAARRTATAKAATGATPDEPTRPHTPRARGGRRRVPQSADRTQR